ncbi:hypothetical protein CHUAL_000739 [Chamberlinius hualienensis]
MKVNYLILIVIVILHNVYMYNCEKEPVDVDDRPKVGQQPVKSSNSSDSDFGDFKRPAPILDKFKDNELGFIHALVAAVSVIVVSELGDKTFFIAAIMAMRHSRLTVFMGAITALAVMTILSACLGFAITVIPRIYTYYVSTALFAIFGLKMLREGYYMSPTEGQEEFDEVQADLRRRDDELQKSSQEHLLTDVEAGLSRGVKHKVLSYISAIFIQAFTLTFLAEWGDRSQLTTIILAARENAIGVTIGGIIGHGLCTALAVIGGKIVAQKISVRTVTIIGGVVFIAFALSAFILSPLD